MAATTLATFATEETADCVEACPVQGFESSLVVATYQLHKAGSEETASSPNAAVTTAPASDRRCGTLQHFHLQLDKTHSTNDNSSSNDVSVAKIEQLETSSGVFDIKWSSHALNGKAMLASATAGGVLELYELVDAATDESTAATEPADSHHRVLRHTDITTDGDESSMCLSLDWNNRVIPNQEPAICVSHSDGCVQIETRACLCMFLQIF